jgi:hypothetical protein
MRGKASAPANGNGRAASNGKPAFKLVGGPNMAATGPQRHHRSDLSDGGRSTALVPLAAGQSTALVPLARHPAKGTTKIAEAVALLLPGPDTPGFDLCSPRSLQVWLALVHHAARHGQWCSPDRLPPGDHYEELRSIRPSGMTANWTVEQLAHACGVDARSVHRLLSELRDWGWLRWSRVRGDDGKFTGILYVLQIPPCKLTDTATHHYRHQLRPACFDCKCSVIHAAFFEARA